MNATDPRLLLLKRAISQPHLSAWLDTDLFQVPLVGMTRPQRRAVERVLAARRVRTVRDALAAHPCPYDVAESIASWLHDAIQAVDAPPPDLVPGLAPAEVDRWSRAWSMDDLFDVRLTTLQADRILYVPELAWDPHTHATARSVLHKAGTLKRHPAEAKSVAAQMNNLAGARKAGIEREETIRPTWRPPNEPTLKPWWTATLARFEALRAQHVPIGARRESAVQVQEDPPALIVTEGFFEDHGRRVIPLAGTPTPARIGELLKQNPWVELNPLMALLSLFSSGSTSPQRALLVHALSTPSWERDLGFFDRLLGARPADAPRLGWRLQVDKYDGWSLEPVAVTPRKNGVSLRRLTAADRDTIDTDEPNDTALLVGSLYQPYQEDDAMQALARLVGHPRLYLGTRNAEPLKVEVSTISVQLVERDGLFRFVPRLGEADFAWPAEPFHGGWLGVIDGNVARVASVKPSTATAIDAVVRRGAALPADALPGLLARLPQLARLIPIAVPEALRGEPLLPDTRPLIRLAGDPQGLTVVVRSRPAAERAAEVPGEGPTELYITRDERRMFIQRDPVEEVRAGRALLDSLGLPASAECAPWTWELKEPRRVLDLLAALRERTSEVQIEWTGTVTTVGRRLRGKDLRLQVGSGRDWFGLQGKAKVDGAGVDLEGLLDAIEEGTGWVRLSDGAWHRIEDDLRQALGVAARMKDRSGVRLQAVHAPWLNSLKDAGIDVEAPPDFWSLSDRIEAARKLTVEPPPGLTAELRSYQLEGFQWLASLAMWSPGALLADDMGLGKTIQALALLLHRKSLGPAIVVAPTSVVDNWGSEIARFAPGLTVRVHRGAGRLDRLTDLGPGTVLLTSFDVLIRDAQQLSEIEFGTAVFDEAHNLKNPTALRSRAAWTVRAPFRLALSGTPVENHLGDLWALFRLAVPGLLGSLERFRSGYMSEDSDAEARTALSRLIRPFLLRRRKGEVERDLPARTEIVVPVTLSADERALYERERLSAIRDLSAGSSGPDSRFQVLAALTRLRQLACNPRLVDVSAAVPSSKLAQVRQMVSALREEGHKVLIFSQFARHLAIVRDALTEDGVSMRYLDGSTPAEQRKKEVAAFQRGETDAFLISLKAGGTGLNLTAATYVIHLDPWWNPAAEDQATDRAHRIGQTRPVTVYRLVSRGTIEESIVQLHAQKRELASAILEGVDDARRFSVDELLALMMGAPAAEADVVEFAESVDGPISLPGPTTKARVVDEVIAEVVEDKPSSSHDAGRAVSAFVAWMEGEAAAGRMNPGTVNGYRRHALRFGEWASGRSGRLDDLGTTWLATSDISPGSRGTARSVMTKLSSWAQQI